MPRMTTPNCLCGKTPVYKVMVSMYPVNPKKGGRYTISAPTFSVCAECFQPDLGSLRQRIRNQMAKLYCTVCDACARRSGYPQLPDPTPPTADSDVLQHQVLQGKC